MTIDEAVALLGTIDLPTFNILEELINQEAENQHEKTLR